MAQVIIAGQEAPEEVTDVQAREVLAKKNDPKWKGTIEVNGHNLPKGKIQDVRIGASSQARKAAYDLNVEEDRAKIREAEAEVEKIVAEGLPAGRELAWYGRPHAEFVAEHPEHDERVGYVFNDMFGLVHWAVVEFAIRQRGVLRDEAGAWSYRAERVQGRRAPDVSQAVAVRAIVKGIAELRARREWAERGGEGEPPPYVPVRREAAEAMESAGEAEGGGVDDIPF